MLARVARQVVELQSRYNELHNVGAEQSVSAATFHALLRSVPGVRAETREAVASSFTALGVRSFLASLCVCACGSVEDKLHILFRLYDDNEDDALDAAELRNLLLGSIQAVLMLVEATTAGVGGAVCVPQAQLTTRYLSH